MLIFRKALGILYDTDYYIAKKPDYLKDHVFFDRFCFDFVSMLGDNMIKLNFTDIEYIIRKVYQHSTHFVPQEKDLHIRLLKIESVVSPFSMDKMVIDKKTL